MDSECNLPVEVIEHVLSFLSVPTICKMRVVCKEWNELTLNPTFHALCDKNGKNEDYLFLWRKDNVLATSRKNVSPKFGTNFHFFDLDMERWYSMPSEVDPVDQVLEAKIMAPWFPSMDNSLVCEVFPYYNAKKPTLTLCILDPIAKTSDVPPYVNAFLHVDLPAYDDADPSLVIVVDQATYSYKVFFFNVLKNMPLVYMHKSGTQGWRPIAGLARRVDDAIAFRNTAFASISTCSGTGASLQPCVQLRLFRYQVEGNTFAKVWQLDFQRLVVFSKLVVRRNRLFVLVTTRLPRLILISDSEDSEDESEPEGCFSTCQDEEGALFEMYEILLDKGSAKPVVQFTEDALRAVWGGDICDNFWSAFPCLDSKGGYSSVVLMHHHSGELRRFHLATGAVDVLPACPLSTTIPDMEGVTSTFHAKTMPLSLREVLEHEPPTL